MHTHTHAHNNNKENAFKTGNSVSSSEAAEVDQLYLSLRHKKTLCFFAAERLGSYNSAFCFIRVKVGRKTRGGRIKKNRQIKNAHIKQTDQNPPGGAKFDSLLWTLNIPFAAVRSPDTIWNNIRRT